ncbi:MAG: diguanylate cyclase [Gemmatimonadaceae bacterium]
MSGGQIRVLCVSPNAADAERMRQALSRTRADGTTSTCTDLELKHVGGVGEALERLGEDRFDATILDLSAPEGRDFESLLRVHERAPDVPIIVITAPGDEALAMLALKEGAQDSLDRKQVTGNLLVRSIRYAIERHQLQVALRAMSLIDDLTGLYNRRGFLTLAKQQLKVADRMKKRVSQIFVDLDGLKAINDAQGHRAGDHALIEAADILKETFRDSDIIARIGGDEFVVLAMETSGATAETFAARLAENVRVRNARDARLVPLSFSMGVAYYDPENPCTIEELLARADTLMYNEKRAKQQTPARGVPTFRDDDRSFKGLAPLGD